MSLKTIPFKKLSTEGPVIHFAHANGFPPEAYQQFLSPFLKSHQVIASKFRPLWGGESPDQLRHWEYFADDLIRFLDEQGLKNIIGMGHSLGGVTSLIASIKRPDLFSKLILLDPVIFHGSFLKIMKIVPFSLRKKIIPIAKIAMKRKDLWDSKTEVYESWRKKRVFKRFSDEVLQNLIEHAIVARSDGKMTLAYSKEWETQVYITAPLMFDQVKKCQTEMFVIKGANTDVITPEVWAAWQQAQSNNQFVEFPETGHLLPLEKPLALAKEILARI